MSASYANLMKRKQREFYLSEEGTISLLKWYYTHQPLAERYQDVG